MGNSRLGIFSEKTEKSIEKLKDKSIELQKSLDNIRRETIEREISKLEIGENDVIILRGTFDQIFIDSFADVAGDKGLSNMMIVLPENCNIETMDREAFELLVDRIAKERANKENN